MMERKKTIIIAVIINAALLVVLFALAITQEEEYPQDVMVRGPQVEIPEISASTSMNAPQIAHVREPLLGQTVESTVAPIKDIQEPEVAAATPPKIIKPQIAHKLPITVPVPQAPIKATQPEVAANALVKPVKNEVIVKKGDSLDKIAKNHKTTVDEIVKLNQLPGTFLKIGQVLKIPEPKAQGAVTAKPLPEKAQNALEYYVVKVGDNPWSIASKNHMKVEELLKLNQLNEEKARKLKPGDRLRIR